MKNQFIISILLALVHGKLSPINVDPRIEPAAKSIADIIDEFFTKPKIEFLVIKYKLSDNHHYNDVIASVFKNVLENSHAKVQIVKNEILYRSAIIFTNPEHIDDLLEKLENQDKSGDKTLPKLKNFIVCEFIQLPIKSDMHHYLLEGNEEIQLARYERFADEKTCGELKLIKLNVFDKHAQTWKKKLESNDSFMDLKECKIATKLYQKFWLPTEDHKSGRAKSPFTEVLEMMASVGNFTLANDSRETMANPILRIADVIQIMTYNQRNFDSVLVFAEIHLMVAVTPNRLYNSYEKLYLPFDKETWIFIFIVFGSTFGLIFICNQLPQWMQNIVYGECIKTPTFNVISIFFGMGQIKLPEKLFPRLLLLLFIFYCLIFRTVHQSKLFEFITSEMRLEPVKTVEQTLAENYTLCYDGLNNLNIQAFFHHLRPEK
jgi:hypothetical protein